jgi:hypothetical protein
MAAPTKPQTNIRSAPQRSERLNVDVPIPIEFSGKRSLRVMMINNTIAQSQSRDSRKIAAVIVIIGNKYEIACRTIRIANRAMTNPIQVDVETAVRIGNDLGILAI